MKKVMVWTGAGQIGMAIARRMGYGMKIVVGDKKIENAKAIADIINGADMMSRRLKPTCPNAILYLS